MIALGLPLKPRSSPPPTPLILNLVTSSKSLLPYKVPGARGEDMDVFGTIILPATVSTENFKSVYSQGGLSPPNTYNLCCSQQSLCEDGDPLDLPRGSNCSHLLNVYHESGPA